MASLSQFLAHIYTMTIVCFSILFLEIVIFVHGAASRATKPRPITTAHFLKLVDEKAPAQQYNFGLGFEPLDCRVCLSHYQEGDEVRRLKCNHTFHKDCLDTWLQQDSATCPLCRNAVLPEKVVDKHRMHRMNHHLQEDYGGSDEELMFLLNALHGNFLRRFY